MNDIEKDKINAFLADDVMCKAVEKVLISVIDIDFKDYTDRLNNDELGAKVRAVTEAKIFISQGFDKLLEFKKGETHIKSKNKAI
jgi:aspartate/tyrosine/aromatic aminotransferase